MGTFSTPTRVRVCCREATSPISSIAPETSGSLPPEGTADLIACLSGGIWADERFVFSPGPTTKKARNLAANPHAVVHLESGAQVVVLECRARELVDPVALEAFRVRYNAKYDWDSSLDQLSSGGVFELWPNKAFAWCGDHGEDFSGTATRWTFAPASD